MIGRAFAGHPYRIAAAVAGAAIALAAVWYLASPLWIRTYANEALPTGQPPPAPSGAIATRAASPAASSASLAPAASRAEPRVLRRGQLGYVDQLHNGKGEVQLIDVGNVQLVLRFADVAITNAPDVHVYLSSDTGGTYVPANTLYVGPLKATNGSFNYELAPGTDVAPYRSVVVWCRAFSVLVTWADLT